MDTAKRKALIAELSKQPEPQIVSVDRFFDGNDDLGSIGCNLIEHPGVDTFREVLTGLLRRSDVEGVYARIAELDPGEGCWPFTDVIYVVGTISVETLRSVVDKLQPDDVGPPEAYGVPSLIAEKHIAPVLIVWWD
jgi:hypothetical protein